jgi:hypothetical protein
MRRANKMILGLAAGLLVVSTTAAAIVGATIARGSETEPERIAAIAADIVDCTPPPGYHERNGLILGNVSLVTYETYETSHHQGHIIIAQISGRFDSEQTGLESVARARAYPNRQHRFNRDRMRLVDTKAILVNGELTTLTVREGTGSDGKQYREALAPFRGKKGPALLMMTAPAADWDEVELQALLASVQ